MAFVLCMFRNIDDVAFVQKIGESEVSMAQDTPPSDDTILQLIHDANGAIAPDDLIEKLLSEYEMVAIIESLQRGIERNKITLDRDGMIIAAQELAKVA